MKILGNLIIALLGGIIAVFIYRAIDNKDRSPGDGDRINPFKRNTSFASSSADSINNVFNVGFGEAAESTLAQVVHIRARVATPAPQDPFFDFFGDGFWGRQYRNQQRQPQMQEASGSGVIVKSDGYIVTNNHVVDRAEEIFVSLYNGRDYRASLVGTYPSTDLAVIKIDEKDLPEANLANSDNVRVGDWVLAVGNPLNFASTVTAGIE
jgi:serine protease Do